MSEWPKERDWKSRMCRKVHRGFKSLSLRSAERPPERRAFAFQRVGYDAAAFGEVAEWLKAAPC